jgi:ribonuclease E
MLISYIPGEECRVAVVEDGKLEEFHSERASNISRVGNIYIGTVTNVEPAIQAAFVDFGVEHHGFLHVTDVHPRYFPGEDEDSTTERVGKKTPRRDRPPIQRCFKRGDQVEVQVLKEGVGTKGPTLTSYLSIPGRFLVMMPQMDRVGVSRKVEDEDQRRQMREILDQLELPEGFGFIVRTAGMDRTKMELKRDLAYLQRLWKDMETRRAGGNKPRLLYSESDLLVRALRDMVGPEIEEIVIDNELALARAARFLKIVSPRSKVRVLQYQGQTPLFHAFGIEQQLALMHAREVPLPSGGRLVIDETEALVAIDVNSGKMRDARDAETNAYKTNCEAVEEICRQLKLRDLGGIVINDLIDMRHASHRKDIEQRFRERMKRDRSRSTLLPISDFGILEMTRQRMRGSHESIHFVDCPTCRGRGMVQKPDSITADALRNLAALLDHGHVGRVEMVVAPRVASELLSSRRKTLNKIERASGKHVDVRVSETVAVDRVSFYAYDANGADIDVEKMPRPKTPTDMKVWEVTKDAEDEGWAAEATEVPAAPEPDLTPAEQAEVAEMPAHPIEFDIDEPEGAPASGQQQQGQEHGEGGGRRRRRRRRRGRGGRGPDGPPSHIPGPVAPAHGMQDGQAPVLSDGSMVSHTEVPTAPAAAPPADGQAPQGGQPGQGEGRRRRRRRRGRGGRDGQPDGAPQGAPQGAPTAAPSQPSASEEPDDESPRGDSWDVPASSVRPLPSAAAEQGNDEHDEGPEDGVVNAAPDASQDPGQPNQGGEGGGRRRRRRRRGRGRGGDQQGAQQGGHQGGQAGNQAQPGHKGHAAPQRQPRHGNTEGQQHAQPPAGNQSRSEHQESRAGDAYQKREQPAPEPKPAPPSANAAPAPQGDGKPKRFLYSARRKLTPGEVAKQRPRE